MRDQLSSDAEHRHHSSSLHSNSINENGRKPATLESVATISYKNVRQDPSYSKPLSVGPSDHSSNDDDRPALPASASWAKAGNSGPSTPTLKSAPSERSLTPDNFGPPLSVAVAAAAAQKQQQAAAASKRKMEKKKRKEQLSQKAESSSGSRPATPSTIHDNELDTLGISTEDLSESTKGRERKYYDGLIQFVFGDALNDWQSTQVNSSEDTDDDAPVGVSALHDDAEEEIAAATHSSDEDEAAESTVSPLEFLMRSGPSTPVYNGSFNPFAHQILRSTGSLFESPMRKCSRFGFAQI